MVALCEGTSEIEVNNIEYEVGGGGGGGGGGEP